MATRADFYVGKGVDAEWLGSIAFDGYLSGIPSAVLTAPTEESYRHAVSAMLASRDDGTTPDRGWPWPWDDSRTTDYSYTWDAGQVWWTCFGHGWWLTSVDPDDDDHDDQRAPKVDFPDMTARRRLAAGTRRDSIMIIGLPPEKP